MRLCLLLPLTACNGDKTGGDGAGGGFDTATSCLPGTVFAPVDDAISGLTTTADGADWAMGNEGGWWKDAGAGWTTVDSLRGLTGPMVSAGNRLWVLGSELLYWSDGETWTEADPGLPYVYYHSLAALSDGRVVVVGWESCEDCNTVPAHLLIGDETGFTDTYLGDLEDPPGAVGADEEGRALAVGADRAWLWEGSTWTEQSLPVSDRWMAVRGFAGSWALASEGGRVLRGKEGDWQEEELVTGGYLTVTDIGGTDLSDLWVTGYSGEDYAWPAELWHDDGSGFIEVQTPSAPIWAALPTGPGTIRVGADGPLIAEGDTTGVAETWTTPHWSADGAAVTLDDGTTFLLDRDGVLVEGVLGEWSVVGHLGVPYPTDVTATACGDVAFGLSEVGAFVDWDGTTATLSSIPDDGSRYQSVAATADCEPIVGGFGVDGGSEESSGVLRLRQGGSWSDISLPEGCGPIYEIDAPSLTNLTIWAPDRLWTGDGTTWTEVSTPGFVADLLRTADGRLWVAMDADGAGLAELVDGELLPVAGSPDRLDRLVADGNSIVTAGYNDGAMLVYRWDGDWTEIARADEFGEIAVPKEGSLVLLSHGLVETICL